MREVTFLELPDLVATTERAAIIQLQQRSTSTGKLATSSTKQFSLKRPGKHKGIDWHNSKDWALFVLLAIVLWGTAIYFSSDVKAALSLPQTCTVE